MERPPAHRRVRVRARGFVTLGVFAALAVAVWLALGHAGRGPNAHGPSPSATGSGSHPTIGSAAWQGLQPIGGAAPTVTAAAADPDGTLWLVAAAGGGVPHLLHVGPGGEDGDWAARAGAHIQTIGSDKVWLAAGPQEFSFDKTTHTFQSYTSAPALGAATVAGYSVGLYARATGAPYVLVAPLGASKAQRVALPGALRPTGTPAATVLPGPPAIALVLMGGTVWSVSPLAGTAEVWGHLPPGADPAAAVWGADRLWFPVGAGVESLSPGGTPTPVAAAGAEPPAGGTPLTFSGDRLWWAGADAAYAYAPDGAVVTPHPYPAPGTALLAPGPNGATWVAVGNRFTLFPGPG